VAALRALYYRNPFPSKTEREFLARALNVAPRSIQIWLQNARSRARAECPECHRYIRAYKTATTSTFVAHVACPI